MNSLRTSTIEGTVVNCPRCLTPNDKKRTLAEALVKLPSGGKRSVIVARCVACDMQILLTMTIQAMASDVYYLNNEQSEERSELPELSDSVSTIAAAFEQYQEGLAHYQSEEYTSAYSCLSAAYEWAARQELDRDGRLFVGALANNIGQALGKLHYHEKALEYFHSGLEICDRSDAENYGIILNNIGAAYLHLGRLDLAEQYHGDAYRLHAENQHDSPSFVGQSLINLVFTYEAQAASYADQSDLNMAVAYARKAVELSFKSEDDQQVRIANAMLATLSSQKGSEAFAAGRLEESVSSYDEAAHLHSKVGAALLEIDDYDGLARAQRELGRVDDYVETLRLIEELKDRARYSSGTSLSVHQIPPNDREPDDGERSSGQ
jgi:tetratricopeptide (TPR) repeat protein